MATAAAHPKEKAHWRPEETFALIKIWEDHLHDLRRVKRNAKVYQLIAEKLLDAAISKTLKETKTKIENLANKYRDINKKKGTGQGRITWPYYWDIHKFLNALPMNDQREMLESQCNTVEEIIHQMENDHRSRDDGDAPANMNEDMAHPKQDDACETSSETSCRALSSPVEEAGPSQTGTPQQNACRESLLGPRERRMRQPSNANLLAQLIEEQRQLRLSRKRHGERRKVQREADSAAGRKCAA
ncbi:myb/SANT-like DNA-binding domain-containing protein 1 [Dermacentor albipictus]|uniref:myb/SANT-like DNA-binding domain-containing protein 1 n=1 Tax=Dermacentor albipictus TaxID=60249 RepID=UPI0038FCB821